MNAPRPNTREALDAWLRGELDAEAERAFLAAAEEDPELRREVAEYRDLIGQVRSLPPEIEPARDLWPGIAARIPAGRRRSWTWALAASLLVAAGLALTARQGGLGPERRPPPAEAVTATAPPTLSPMARSAYAQTDQALAEIRLQLRRTVAEREAELPESTRRLLHENLDTIERAIAEIEAALAERPQSPELARTYIAYRQRQIDLLRQVNRAAARL